MGSMVTFIRPLGALVSTMCLWAVGASASLAGCGSPPEGAKSPEPAKMVWGSSDAPSAPDEPPADSDSTPILPTDVDLDALPAAGKRASHERPEAAEPEPPPSEPPPRAAARAASEPSSGPPLEEMRAAVRSKAEKGTKPEKAAPKTAEKSPPVAVATYTGPNPCKATRFSVARVGDACATGGRSAAKAVMKDAIGKALAGGKSLKCSDCHAEQRDYTLKPDAVVRLEQWLDG